MNDYKETLEKIKESYNTKTGEKQRLEKDKIKLQESVKKLEELSITNAKIVELLVAVSGCARDKARSQLEVIVTTALSYVSDENYGFSIEQVNDKSNSYEFYVVSEVNGEISKQKPQDACGGGFVDIISTALRFAYLNAFSDPTINNAVILDEPGKMVSEQASVRLAEFIKNLSLSFDRQTLMVTHNENLLWVADKSIHASKTNGKSFVTDMTFSDIDNLF